jgi:hypothetical protein
MPPLGKQLKTILKTKQTLGERYLFFLDALASSAAERQKEIKKTKPESEPEPFSYPYCYPRRRVALKKTALANRATRKERDGK